MSVRYLLTLLATIVEVRAFWRMRCGTIQTGRVDPIITPGGVSSHVHMVSGASNLNTTSTYDSLRQSFCTSCQIQDDKSAYWTPLLYYEKSDGSFVPVRDDGTVVYYLGRGDDRANIVSFPPGLKIVSGDPTLRSYDNITMTYSSSKSVGRPVADRVSFNCLGTNYASNPETPGMIKTDCPAGLRAQIQFQSCWDGASLYKSDQSHVAYLSQIDNGVCPPTHPKLLPHLFYEIYYYPNEIDTSDGGRFVFANGDLTGYGFHGDFLNGWDPDVLQAGIDQCINTVDSGLISDCPPLFASNDDYFDQNCPERAPVINEQVKEVLNTLPGCNVPTAGPGRASNACDQAKPSLNTPINDDGQTREVPTNVTSRGGMAYVGCYLDNTGGRSLKNASYADNGMTLETCADFCRGKGFTIFGTEYARECYCGNSISAAVVAQTDCAMACSGNLTEFCGSSNRLSVWTLDTSPLSTTSLGTTPSASQTVPTTLSTESVATTSPHTSGASYLGCYSDATTSRSIVGGYSGNSNMSIEYCKSLARDENYKYFGLEYGGECYAGNSINSQQITASNCSMACKGNSQQICGGKGSLSAFQNNQYVQPTNNQVNVSDTIYTYQGCSTEGTTGRALGGSASYSFTDSAMTVDKCASTCYERGYRYIGTEYSTECYCNDAGLVNGASLAASNISCSMICAGNKSQFCGGSRTLSIFRRESDN